MYSAVYLQREHKLFRSWWTQAASSFSVWFGGRLGTAPNRGVSAWQLPPTKPRVHLSLCLLRAPCWALEALAVHPGEWEKSLGVRPTGKGNNSSRHHPFYFLLLETMSIHAPISPLAVTLIGLHLADGWTVPGLSSSCFPFLFTGKSSHLCP